MQLQVLFGKRTREARLLAGLSQEELGEKVGLHRTYVGSVERGERNISLNNIFKLSEALGVKTSFLVQDIDKLQ